MSAVASATRAVPYQGLRPFAEEDAGFFFGRDREADVIIANLRASRLTVLYGPSGVGKTSLLRAGVEARLRERASSNYDRLGTPEFVPVVFDGWRDDPGPGLARAIAVEVARWCGEPFEPPGSLAETIIAAAARTNAALLVILDQFEDLSLYHSMRNGAGSFVSEFPALVNDRRLRVNFLVSIREDALAQLDRFKHAIPGLLDTRLRVKPLSGDAAQEAVTGPIDKYNEAVGPDEQVTIEDKLVEAVLDQVEVGKVRAKHVGQGLVASSQPTGTGDANGAGVSGPGDANGAGVTGADGALGVEASYLQLVMQRLWEHEIVKGAHAGAAERVLRRSALEELGGAQTIVREHLHDALSDLSPTQVAAAVDIFQYLVTPSGTKITQSLATLAAWSGHSPAEVGSLLEKLQGDARIIRTVPPEPGATENRYEIFHDVLADAVLEWSNGEIEKRRLAVLAQENARLEQEKHEAETRAALERRRRLLAVGLLLLALAGGIAAFLFWRSAVAQRNTANRERTTARQAGTLARYDGVVSQAQALLGTRPDLSLLLALDVYRHMAPGLPAATVRATLLAGISAISGTDSRVLQGQTDTVTSVAFHGTTLAAASADGTIYLWTTHPSRLLKTLGQSGGHGVNSVAFSPDGATLAAAGADGMLRRWNVASGQPIPPALDLKSDGALIRVAFSPDGRTLAAASADGSVTLWHVVGTAPLRKAGVIRSSVAAGVFDVRSIAFSPDSHLLAAAGQFTQVPGVQDGRLELWSVAGATVRETIPFPRPLYGVGFSPAGGRVAAGGLDGRVWIVDPASRTRSPISGTGPAIDGIAFTPDGHLAAAAADGTVQYWDLAARTKIVLRGHTGTATAVAFSGDGRTLAASSSDHTVRLWSPGAPDQFPYTLQPGKTNVRAVAYAPVGGTVAWARGIGSRTSTIELWDSVHSRMIRTITTHDGTIRSLAFSPDGRLLMSGSAGGTVQLWQASSGSPEGAPLFHEPGVAVNSVAFNPTKPWVAFDAGAGKVELKNLDTRQPHLLRPQRGYIFAVAFSHDGSRLAAGGDGGTIYVWDAPSGRPRAKLTGHTDAVFTLEFSPRNNDLLASGSADDTIRLWNVSTGNEADAPLTGHTDWVRSIAFAPNGLLLASGGADGAVLLWDIGSGQGGQSQLDAKLGQIGFVNALAFSPDGGTLVVGARDGALRTWSPVGLPASQALVSTVCGLVGDGLSAAEKVRYMPLQLAYQNPCR